ncbi:MAG: hypothetical protein IKH71_09560 [Oscillospiraceae bacterium]|nr:hypothetical protein [Prevotella sp.]MBR3024685.1 hypothetical protein [Oscillospiraceae bacterium]
MSTADIEKLAASGAEMPADLNGAEQLLFLSLRQLYAIFRTGKLQRDIAKHEKSMIYDQYRKYELEYRSWTAGWERERRVQAMIQEISESGCEVCKRMLRTMEGIEK